MLQSFARNILKSYGFLVAGPARIPFSELPRLNLPEGSAEWRLCSTWRKKPSGVPRLVGTSPLGLLDEEQEGGVALLLILDDLAL